MKLNRKHILEIYDMDDGSVGKLSYSDPVQPLIRKPYYATFEGHDGTDISKKHETYDEAEKWLLLQGAVIKGLTEE